jgi:hypothetical protein
MAGDWIKMRNNLWDDPRISQICDLTDVSEATVIGGLYWLWSAADEHTEDGFMPGLSINGIDRKTGVKGLGSALVSIEWIEEANGGINILRFDEHNGSSAKRRSSDAQRKANSRNMSAIDADNSTTYSGQDAPNCGAREEKNREENKELKSKATTAPQAAGAKAQKFDAIAFFEPHLVSPQVLNDWLRIRKGKRLVSTETAFNGFIAEVHKTGMCVADAIQLCCVRGWGGLDAEWLKPKSQASPVAGYQTQNEKAKAWADKLIRNKQHEQRTPNFIDINTIEAAEPVT